LTPRRIAWRDASPVTICFAIFSFSCSIRANSHVARNFI
jgi:hypothetical protein